MREYSVGKKDRKNPAILSRSSTVARTSWSCISRDTHARRGQSHRLAPHSARFHLPWPVLPRPPDTTQIWSSNAFLPAVAAMSSRSESRHPLETGHWMLLRPRSVKRISHSTCSPRSDTTCSDPSWLIVRPCRGTPGTHPLSWHINRSIPSSPCKVLGFFKVQAARLATGEFASSHAAQTGLKRKRQKDNGWHLLQTLRIELRTFCVPKHFCC